MTNDPKRRFLRLYYDDLERDYPEVWFDPTAGWTYVRLLSLAEKAWPSAPELPRACRRADLTMLTNVGLVTLLEHGRFQMKGWMAERQERADKARESVRQRNDRSTTVDRTYNDRSTRDSSTRASSSSSGSSSPVVVGGSGGVEPDELAVFAFLAQNGAAIAPENGLGRRLLKLMDRRTPATVLAAAQALLVDGPFSDRQWVFGLEGAIEPPPDPKTAAKAAQQAEADRVAAKRQQRLDAEREARRLEHYRNTGEWPYPGQPPVIA